MQRKKGGDTGPLFPTPLAKGKEAGPSSRPLLKEVLPLLQQPLQDIRSTQREKGGKTSALSPFALSPTFNDLEREGERGEEGGESYCTESNYSAVSPSFRRGPTKEEEGGGGGWH